MYGVDDAISNIASAIETTINERVSTLLKVLPNKGDRTERDNRTLKQLLHSTIEVRLLEVLVRKLKKRIEARTGPGKPCETCALLDNLSPGPKANLKWLHTCPSTLASLDDSDDDDDDAYRACGRTKMTAREYFLARGYRQNRRPERKTPPTSGETKPPSPWANLTREPMPEPKTSGVTKPPSLVCV